MEISYKKTKAVLRAAKQSLYEKCAPSQPNVKSCSAGAAIDEILEKFKDCDASSVRMPVYVIIHPAEVPLVPATTYSVIAEDIRMIKHSLVVVAENMESWYFPPLKVPSDLSSNKSDYVVVLKNFPPKCDCSLNGKIALDTFSKKGAIHEVFPSKDKLRVYQRTTEAAQKFCDEAAELFQPSTRAKIIQNA
ncbi:hypothetical protein QYM36_008327 [Artemia franciscana]|uniref:Uncharacterized protein n=1 Tax=Artemia franciscana TaxID=6661 RepID=A0AA88LME7_ARTSF|nr:hypothetical protein QYM36_008327 [Artemia franciscana]